MHDPSVCGLKRRSLEKRQEKFGEKEWSDDVRPELHVESFFGELVYRRRHNSTERNVSERL